jgi:hypothetical protein
MAAEVRRSIFMKYGISLFIGRISACIVLALLLAAGTAWAHHSAVDVQDKPVTMIGTLTKLDWRNPHIAFTLEVKGKDGQAESWIISTGPPSRFAMRKISKADFEKLIGQTLTVEASTARDGTRRGYTKKITFPDGRVVAG